jgi:hypothetical protein
MQRNKSSGLFTKPSIVNGLLIPVLFFQKIPGYLGLNGFPGGWGTYCSQECTNDVYGSRKTMKASNGS